MKFYFYIFIFFILAYPSNSNASIGIECIDGSEMRCPGSDDPAAICDQGVVKIEQCKLFCADTACTTKINRGTISKFDKICPGPAYGREDKDVVLKPNKITGNIIRCAQLMIFKAGDSLIINYTAMFAAWIHYIVLFAIVIFGLRMMFGMTRDHNLTVVIMLKIVFVLYITSYPGTFKLLMVKDALYQASTNIVKNILIVPEQRQDGVVISIPFTKGGLNISLFSSFTSIMCQPDGRSIFNVAESFTGTLLDCKNYGLPSVFDAIDSLMMKQLGINEQRIIADPQAKNRVVIGLALLAAGLFFTGSVGLTVAMIVIAYLFTMIFAFAQILMLFIISMIAINFLVAIAPIAIAGILFDQTKRMTKVWLGYLLTYTVLPIVLSGFVFIMGALIFQIVDDAEFQYQEIYKKAGVAVQEKAKISTLFGINTDAKIGKIMESDESLNSFAHDKLGNYQRQKENAGLSSFGEIAKSVTGIFSVSSIKIVGDNATEQDKINSITKENLRKLIAIKLTLIIFFILMAAIVEEIPNIATKVAGNAASGAADIVLKPRQLAERKVENTAKKFGSNMLKQ